MGVIKRDFGMAKRHTVKRFRKLLSLDALHEANLRNNPLPYLERASERIFQLERALFEAAAAARPPPGAAAAGETIAMSKAEYQRLVDCRAIVMRSLDQLGAAEDIFGPASDQA